MKREAKRALGRVAAVLAVATVTISCGDGGSGSVETEARGDPPSELPGQFGQLDGGWATIVASQDRVYGVGLSTPATEPSPATIGQRVDLDDGAVADIPAPPGDPLLIDSATTTDEGELVLLGRPCRTLLFTDEDSSDLCDPGAVSYVLDDDGQNWRSVPTPAATGAALFAQTRVEGGPVAVLSSVEPGSGYVAAVFSDTQWLAVATSTLASDADQFCATDDTLFHLGASATAEMRPRREGFDPSTVFAHSFASVDLTTGERMELTVPDLYPFNALAPTRLACDRQHPTMATLTERGFPPQAWTLTEERQWTPLPSISGDRPAGVAAATSSTSVVFTWAVTVDESGVPTPETGRAGISAISPGGEVFLLRDNSQDTTVVPVDKSDQVLLIGPLTQPDGEDPGAPQPADTVPVEVVDVPA